MKKLLLTGIAALFLATGVAHTETNALGCFARAYDKAHLAEHPDQLVTAVKLHIIKWKEDESYFEFAFVSTPAAADRDAPLTVECIKI
jgi:hypothetical protein